MRSSAQSDAFCLTKEKAWPVPSEQLAHRTYAPTSSDAHEREAAGSVICTARPGTCEELVAETREETLLFWCAGTKPINLDATTHFATLVGERNLGARGLGRLRLPGLQVPE